MDGQSAVHGRVVLETVDVRAPAFRLRWLRPPCLLSTALKLLPERACLDSAHACSVVTTRPTNAANAIASALTIANN
jgi:hypothetical protein